MRTLVVGGRFQASTTADFSDAVGLFTIPGPPADNTLTSIPSLHLPFLIVMSATFLRPG
jgi:hypothetical protein